MTIKEIVTLDDWINIQIAVVELSGVEEKRLQPRLRFFVFVFVISMMLCVIGFVYKLYLAALVELIAAVYAVIQIAFSKKINLKRLKKGIRKNIKLVEEKYNYSMEKMEVITEIKDDYIESTTLDTTTKYQKKAYITHFENELFYIIEFTKGRYLFFKKEIFKDKDAFLEIINEIKNVKSV